MAAATTTGREPADTQGNENSWRKPLSWIIALFIVFWVASLLLTTLVFGPGENSSCAPHPRIATAKKATGFTLTGLPSSLTTAFGYTRNPRSVVASFTAIRPRSRKGHVVRWPKAIMTAQVPMITASGAQLGATLKVEANRVAHTDAYVLVACVQTNKNKLIDPGSYTGSILFPGAKVPHGGAMRITATFQNTFVPWIFGALGPWLVALGILYTVAVLLRRASPRGDVRLLRRIPGEIFSVNGLIAAIAGEGAVFAAWRAQCLDNVTWGAVPPDIFVTLVALIGAAAAAATIPMGLATRPVTTKPVTTSQ